PLVCMAAVLAGELGAPLTATIFSLELTHDVNALLPLLLATGISYGFTVLAMKRSIMTEKIARRGFHIYREYGVDPLERQYVEDVMTRDVQSIPATMTIGQTLATYFGPQQMHRAFPVVDDDQHVIGMLDRATLLKQENHEATVRTLYGANPPLVAVPGETCREVAACLATHALERLPVVERAGSTRLIGIIARSDLVKPSRTWVDEERKRERLMGHAAMRWRRRNPTEKSL
ncbi:MAG: CBS domain-containing protein, partial [Burkholderiales bacterium]|nr:CBS domain-containing protein [Burkholderiales bacterium]